MPTVFTKDGFESSSIARTGPNQSMSTLSAGTAKPSSGLSRLPGFR